MKQVIKIIDEMIEEIWEEYKTYWQSGFLYDIEILQELKSRIESLPQEPTIK